MSHDRTARRAIRFDARRSTGYVAGAYVMHDAVVSTHYTTVNVVRTIEDLLSLEHLNLHDGGVKTLTTPTASTGRFGKG